MNWIYFILIGWWFAPLWFTFGVLMCWNPIGWIMVYQTPRVLFGEN